MNKELRDKWITALRSGEYKQGQSALRTSTKHGDRYCCLGVLADIVDSKGWRRKLFPGLDWTIHRTESGRLNKTLRHRIRLDVEIENQLIDMNDNGKRFKTIANWIEKNIELT